MFPRLIALSVLLVMGVAGTAGAERASAAPAAEGLATEPASAPIDDAAMADGVFLEEDGAIIIEVESAPPAGAWEAETLLAGYTGRCYYTWRGPDLFGEPGRGTLGYRIRVFTPGRYNLRLHNRHDLPDATLENDAWMRVDDGEWIKTYSAWRGRWVWHSAHEHAHQKVPASFDLAAGDHVIYLSGRSKNFSVDRFVLYLGGNPDAGSPQLSGPESAMLPERTPSAVVPELPRVAADRPQIADAWRAGRLGEAWLAATRTDEAATGAAVVEAIDEFAAARRSAIADEANDDPLAAAGMLRQLARQLAGHPSVAEIQAEAGRLESSPAGRDAAAAMELLTEARRIAWALPGIRQAEAQPALQAQRDAKLPAVAEAIEQIRVRFGQTRARGRAETLAAEVGLQQQ